MTRRLAEHLNAVDDGAARDALARCCGARRWVDGMLAARPFASDRAVLEAADRLWWALGRADWLEAFARHPRIGERDTGEPRQAATRDWARGEQAGVEVAGADTRRALAAGNEEYERRFGHVFLICATGRGAREMLRELRRRLENDPARELQVAAGEQAKITRIRLEKLVHP
ncbi:MAG: 2-oxo-4-hydroxy-4-carboxy-5-ureidoimidazoline decarboxylase [Gemmatimonadales bacterium]